jgi:hypothetical protein
MLSMFVQRRRKARPCETVIWHTVAVVGDGAVGLTGVVAPGSSAPTAAPGSSRRPKESGHTGSRRGSCPIGAAAARTPGRRRRPRSASQASDRPPLSGASGGPRSGRRATHPRPRSRPRSSDHHEDEPNPPDVTRSPEHQSGSLHAARGCLAGGAPSRTEPFSSRSHPPRCVVGMDHDAADAPRGSSSARHEEWRSIAWGLVGREGGGMRFLLSAPHERSVPTRSQLLERGSQRHRHLSFARSEPSG